MKNLLTKIVVLFLVFIFTTAFLIYINREKTVKKDVIMGEPTLPTMSFLYGSDRQINEIVGYTSEMEISYMRDSLTPIAADQNINIVIENKSNMIMSGTAKIYQIGSSEALEEIGIDAGNIRGDGNITNISLTATTPLNNDEEYNLVIELKTDRYENIYYYTRIMKISSDETLLKEMDFAKGFSKATLNEESDVDISTYIEPDDTKDNSNLGNVNIHSNYNQIMWGSLKPEKVTEPIIKIHDIIGDVASFEMVYKVRATNEYNTYEYFTVSEFFRVKLNEVSLYLLDYERNTNQLFNVSGGNISASRINLGICDEDTQEFKASEDTSNIAFVKQSGLWLMDISKNTITSVFAFEELDDDDIRNTNISNTINIVSVENNGDVTFIVYGYMNRGEHEGKVGLSLYKYEKNANIVTEKVFIPFNRKYEVLRETLGKLSYVNENDIMYMKLGKSIYSVDFTGNEYVEVIGNLEEGNYSLNEDGDMIAWENSADNNYPDTIKVLDLEKEKEYTITAEEGKCIKVLGFLGDNVVYGVARKSDIVTDSTGEVFVPMYEAKIVTKENEELKNYSKEGFYITGVDVSGNMLNIHRVLKNENGYEATSDYQIFGNEEENNGEVYIDTIVTDSKQKEEVIVFAKKVTTSSKLSNIIPKEILFSDSNKFSIRDIMGEDESYYVYGYGHLISASESLATSIVMADKASGLVLDCNGNKFWTRATKPDSYMMENIGLEGVGADETDRLIKCIKAVLTSNGVPSDNLEEEVRSGKSLISVLNEKLSNAGSSKKAYDLTGCTFEEMLYYVYRGNAVVGRRSDGVYYVIIGYDMYNAIMLDSSTGEIFKQGREETEEMFRLGGYRFMTIF